MDLHADDDFPVGLGALDQFSGALTHAALHQFAGLAENDAAISIARAARRMVASSNAFPMNCSPSGRPLAVNPAGTEMPGRPARLTVTVKTSFRYIETGSKVFS